MAVTLVLMPGMDGTGELFGEFIRVVAGRFETRVVSYPVDRVLSYDELLDVVEEQLRGEGEMLLVAESFSGPLAVKLAEKVGGRVCGVVLVASFVRSPVGRWIRLFVPLIGCGLWLPGFFVRRYLLGSVASPALVGAVKGVVGRVRPQVLAGRVREILAVDVASELRACGVPVLYLRARGDRVVGRRSVEEFRRIRGDGAIRSIEGPHLLLQVKAEEAWGEILGFLSGGAAVGG